MGKRKHVRKRKGRRIDCYNSSQKILLVGEGDFSFAACLARAFRTASNIVATSYLKEARVAKKHWTSREHLEELEKLGCLLLYEVDVYKMQNHPILKKMKFDIIIFNFPHAGHYDYLCERDLQLIEMHRDLVGAYFKSASKMLSVGGEVHLRHRDDYPYNSWNVVLLADKAGLQLKEKVDFVKSDFPGYHNKRGGDSKTNKTFPIVCAFTFKFVLDLPTVNHPKNEEIQDVVYDLSKIDDLVYEMMLMNDVHNPTKIYKIVQEMINDPKNEEIQDEDVTNIAFHNLSKIDDHVSEMIRGGPTMVPTVAPTVAPMVEPTVAPTVEPTVAPTVEPTVAHAIVLFLRRWVKKLGL